MEKLKIAGCWASSCGGCEIATLEIGDNVLKLAEVADIVFWPALVDFKYHDVEQMADNSIDVCLFNGAIQNSEQEHIAKLLRAKSKIMVAYGSCAYEGCIPSLANMTNREGIFSRAYIETPSTDNPNRTFPQTSYQVPEGELTLPQFYDTVKSLAQTVEVDYFVPGCPPVGKQTWAVLESIVQGDLPPRGSVVGAGTRALCEECPKTREEKKVKAFYRPYEIIPDPEKCLLEQGIICCGPATRGGCGVRCIEANMPCRGCFGPPPGVLDQGAKMLSAIASIYDVREEAGMAAMADEVVDPAATFYRFGMAGSILKRKRIR